MTTTTEMKLVPLSKLVPYVNNARTHSPEQINKLRSSLREFGFINPVIIDRDYGVIAGHGRILAAKEEGISEVPCVFADHLTEAQKKAYILADNRMAMDAGWDEELLRVEIESLQAADFDLALTGFDEKELSKLFDDGIEAEEDDFDVDAELQKPTFTKSGDIWTLGRHRLVCGDSTDKATVEMLMDGKKADMVFTDPPYGISVVGNNGKVGADNLAKNGVYMPVKGDETTETTKRFFEVCKDLGFDKFVLWGGNYFIGFLPYSDGWIIWDKRGDMASNNFADGEMAWCSFHTPVRIYKQVWSGMIREGEHEKRVHPTQKPVKLLGEILKDFTDDDDIILDCFGGSGSTLIACEQINRTCYMIEYEAHYVDAIVRRYIEQVGGIDDVRVVRDGAEYKYNEVVTDA